jgi:hypothetical protein
LLFFIGQRPRRGDAFGRLEDAQRGVGLGAALVNGGHNTDRCGTCQLLPPDMRQPPRRERQRQRKYRQKRHCCGGKQGKLRGKS